MATAIVNVCSHCGSDNISIDADAHWDTVTQRWVIDDISSCICYSCNRDSIAIVTRPLTIQEHVVRNTALAAQGKKDLRP